MPPLTGISVTICHPHHLSTINKMSEVKLMNENLRTYFSIYKDMLKLTQHVGLNLSY